METDTSYCLSVLYLETYSFTGSSVGKLILMLTVAKLFLLPSLLFVPYVSVFLLDDVKPRDNQATNEPVVVGRSAPTVHKSEPPAEMNSNSAQHAPQNWTDARFQTKNAVGQVTGKIPPESVVLKAWWAFEEELHLLFEPKTLLLSVTSFYIGLEMGFYTIVFSTAVGFTKNFGSDSQKLVGLVGIFAGVGSLTSGLLIGTFGKFMSRRGYTPIILLGLVIHISSFASIYINLPDAAALSATKGNALLNPPSVVLAMVSAVSLGLGNSCYQTQLTALLASHYADTSSAAFAISEFLHSGTSAASCGCLYAGLHIQLFILTFFCLSSTASFTFVEWQVNHVRGVENIDKMDAQ